MKAEFLRHGAIYGGATLLTGASSVLLVSVYTRALEPSEYGIVEYINVLQLLIQVLAGLELTQAIARFYGGSETDVERRAYASTGFWFLVVAYGIVCVGLFLAADQVEGALFGSIVQTGVLRAALASVYLWIMFYAVRSQLRWELRAKSYAVASLVAVVSNVCFSAYLLLVLHVGLVGVFVGSAVGYGLGVVACLYGLRGTYVWSFDVSKLRTMIAFSLPLTVSTLALLAATYGDRIVIRAAMGFDDLGVYAAGARVASVIALASAGFQLGAAPLIYRNYRRPEMPETLAQIFRLFMAVGLVGVLALAAFSPELVAIFTTSAYSAASRVVPALALATVLASGYIFLPGLTLNNMTSRFAAINITAAGASLVLIAALAQVYGVVGAAIGALAGASLGFALHALFSQRVYHLPIDWRRIVAAVGLAVGAIAIGWSLGVREPAFLIGRVTLLIVSAVGVLILALDRADRLLIRRFIAAPLTSARPTIDP